MALVEKNPKLKCRYPQILQTIMSLSTGLLLRQQLKLRQGVNSLNISTLPEGMIFYTILSEKGILTSGKLMKN